MADREPTWDERILARVNPSVDPTLIAESLRLTPTERLLRLQGMLAFVESVHQGSGHVVPRPARNTHER